MHAWSPHPLFLVPQPDIDEIIFCVAVVIHDRIVQEPQSTHSSVPLSPPPFRVAFLRFHGLPYANTYMPRVPFPRTQGEQAGYDARSLFPFFSEDNNPLYAAPSEQGDGEPRGGREGGREGDSSKKKTRREVPSEETIYYTIRSVCISHVTLDSLYPY